VYIYIDTVKGVLVLVGLRSILRWQSPFQLLR
jgi:hypothetical protein